MSALPVSTQSDEVNELGWAIARLDVWLESMRQPGGYGGPVAHYWQHRLVYCGPGLDWRYEGLLRGYAALWASSGEPRWQQRVRAAAADLLRGQDENGLYRASRFELNPGTLGTPHEAAASLGLLESLGALENPAEAISAARRNLDALIAELWDGQGFRDHRTVAGRVPNKLATLAQALLRLAEELGPEAGEAYLPLARSALDDVLRYQEPGGAVHQYAPGGGKGDGRFFPYYNARCVEGLLLGERLLADQRYGQAARQILERLEDWMNADGSWPQIVYHREQRAEFPRWYAGTADILLAFLAAGRRVPAPALSRLLAAQLPSGAFPTAQGFGAQVGQRPCPTDPRDLLGVVGWNDKVLRLLAALLPQGAAVPETAAAQAQCVAFEHSAVWEGAPVTLRDTPSAVEIFGDVGELLYRWRRGDVWAEYTSRAVEIR